MSQTPMLADLYREIPTELAAVEREIQSALRTERPAVGDMVLHAARYSGKRLRPALVLLVARSVGADPSADIRLPRLGAVVEMVHLATLVHDDVIDGASLRRSQATVNTRWSNYEAVLLGDVLFARAINLLARIGDERALLGLTRSVSELCEGEILQNRHRQDPNLSEALYYDIIGAKTAELYGTGCELGAHLGGADDAASAAYRTFGYELGVAFQIIDDCLDLNGTEDSVGKTLGTDLAQGKMTLPMILLRERCTEAEREILARQILGQGESGDVPRVAELLERHGVVEESMKRADAHVERGLAAVRAVASPDALASLEAVAHFVRHRRL
jgi:octaprenyl-diphosphate synthase